MLKTDMNCFPWNDHEKQETLYLLSIPGMIKSIKEGLDTPVEETYDEPGW